jgi:Fic family protein
MLRYIDRLHDRLHRSIVDKKRKLESKGKLTDKRLSDLERAVEVEFVYNTNSMEGNTFSLGETRMVLRGMTISGKPFTEIQEIKNHPASIEFIKTLAFDRMTSLTEHDILELHKMAMDKVIEDAGKYRQDDYIAVKGAQFTPTSWHEISDEMKELLDFINKNPDGLSPVEIATHAHYFFTRIHPFHDGNGRMARLLTNFILLRNCYPFIVFKKVDRNQYLRSLQKADDGYFRPFLLFVAGLVRQSLETYLHAIEDGGGSGRRQQQKLLPLAELAKRTPYSAAYLRVLANRKTIDVVKDRDGKTWMTTRKIIDNYIAQHKKSQALS